jgi:hypothetical protein
MDAGGRGAMVWGGPRRRCWCLSFIRASLPSSSQDQLSILTYTSASNLQCGDSDSGHEDDDGSTMYGLPTWEKNLLDWMLMRAMIVGGGRKKRQVEYETLSQLTPLAADL